MKKSKNAERLAKIDAYIKILEREINTAVDQGYFVTAATLYERQNTLYSLRNRYRVD